MLGHWIFKEHGARKGIRVEVGAKETPEKALERHFKHHNKFRLESPKDRRPLSEFLPEVTPGVLKFYPATAKGAKKSAATSRPKAIKNPKREPLKPCPFDGGTAWLLNDGATHLPYRVECTRCHCSTTKFRLQVLAVQAWNGRQS